MERTVLLHQLFFLWTPFLCGYFVKAELLIICVGIYYWCCVCRPIAKALWGEAHLLSGSTSVFQAFLLTLCVCFGWIIKYTTEQLWLISLTLSLHVSLTKSTVWPSVMSLLIFFFSGFSQAEHNQQGETTIPDHYETTVPLLLKGKEYRPLNQLRNGVNETITVYGNLAAPA